MLVLKQVIFSNIKHLPLFCICRHQVSKVIREQYVSKGSNSEHEWFMFSSLFTWFLSHMILMILIHVARQTITVGIFI